MVLLPGSGGDQADGVTKAGIAGLIADKVSTS
jgi:hypothetical protein